MATSFIANPGWAQELLRQPEAVAAMHQIASELSSEIKAAIPVVTGATRREYGEMAPQPAIKEGLAGAEIPITSSIWHIIEFGSIHNEPFAPIRRGADAAGLEIDMSGGAA